MRTRMSGLGEAEFARRELSERRAAIFSRRSDLRPSDQEIQKASGLDNAGAGARPDAARAGSGGALTGSLKMVDLAAAAIGRCRLGIRR